MSFYDNASLQDILAQGQGGMGMGQAVQSIPPSPYNQMAQTDPGFVNRITQRMQSLVDPTMDPRSQQLPDQAYGRASSHERGNQGIPDDETSAWETATAILKTPFAVLNTVRDGLQDTLGFGGAQYRRAQRDNVEALQNLPQRQREALGIDRISGIQTPGMAAGETSGTAGAPSSLGSNVGSTMKGYVEWANNMGRDRAQQTMNQVRATINAQYAAGKMTKQELENLNEVLQGVRTNADTNRINSETRGNEITNQYKPQLYESQLSTDRSQRGQYDSAAEQNRAQTRTINEMRDPQVDEAQAKAKGEWTKNYYMGTEGEGKIRASQQEFEQKRDLFPYTLRDKTAETNNRIITGDVARGAYPKAPGMAGASDKYDDAAVKTEYGVRQDVVSALRGNEKQGIPPMSEEQAAEFYRIPTKPKTESLFGIDALWPDSKTLDMARFDPTGTRGFSDIDAGSSSTAPGRSTQQPTPLLPMPGVDPAPSTPSAVRPSGDTIYAITQILRKANPAGSAGDQVQRAQEIAKVYESLDRSSPDAFVASAKSANLSNDEIRALWQAGQGK